MAVKAFPNSFFVGETTFGATGPIVSDNNLYSDGSFTVPDFMNVQTSSVKFKYMDGKIYEGKGFAPDYFVAFNLYALQNATDLQLEKAIDLLK
jgi:C-terminal processing protease CtpA/Prc